MLWLIIGIVVVLVLWLVTVVRERRRLALLAEIDRRFFAIYNALAEMDAKYEEDRLYKEINQ